MQLNEINKPQPNSQLPLTGIRVLDLCDLRGQSCGRMLADLGAEVILVEPPEGMSSRRRAPVVDSQSLYFATHNANKFSVQLDLASQEGKKDFLTLVRSSDMLIDGGDKSIWGMLSTSHSQLRSIYPDLIILSITDFGLQGPYKDFTATESVHMAMSTVLSRSGSNGSPPLLPPGELALETAAIQAAWVALLAYWQRSHNGKGDLLDFSINDAIAQTFDPGVGAAGSAAAGRTPIEVAPHGRPEVNFIPGKLPSVALLYPIFKCADGHIRICVLNPRQWRGMSEWLGPDHPFTHPKFGVTGTRFLNIDAINKLMASLFENQTREHLVAEGQKRGIPIASINLPDEVFDNEHFEQRNLFTKIDIGGKKAKAPSGYFCIDGRRIGINTLAPKLGANTQDLLSSAKVKAALPVTGEESRKPLGGILVLDLGIIVAGGELGRLFADQGATVIKVENKAYSDGLRQSLDNNPVPISFAQTNRNKKSLGLNLRSDKGKEIFLRLAKDADVVISNFKPGTMESLGLGYEVLREINPGIICAESSAMGSAGPQARTMGYGPLVRASTALSGLWRYPEKEMGFGDCVTIFPDHFAARVSATAILAKLIQRKTTAVGGFIDTSQAECIVNALASEFLRESIAPGSLKPMGNQSEFDAPNSLYPCAGKDEWCAISVTNNDQWQGLCRAMNRADLADNTNYQTSEGRLEHRIDIEDIVTRWCKSRSPYAVMNLCQTQGVPAGNMLRLSEFIENPHYNARNFFRKLHQPTVGRAIETENGPVGFSDNIPPPQIQPAPALAEHTRELMSTLIGLSDIEIDALIASGDLEIRKKETGAMQQKVRTLAINSVMKTLLKYHELKHLFKRVNDSKLMD
jgi:crotonobetainyl-CoA:carnitine CoA-transferase CaiB-like acyl-CoA transferase